MARQAERPKNVDPAAAINQAKLLAVVDWAKGFVSPSGKG